ncbi:RcnB family protein [Albimonas pacifica]|uniref:Regulator RcnB of Ni and Co efflux n=1 Tax=Albimonas pacifica TaxID=1114924 RepID=A0A1I3GFL4_9RHOB|nr:RcnB family protein [Albimonas pacifica]SFI22249.1 regulator RcnB of Ni and Co efflux [Albimonas pacifica]
MTPTPATRASARALSAGTDDRRTMRRMGLALAALTALGVAFAAQPVLADPPGGVPPGLAKKGVSKKEWKQFKNGGDARDYDRDRDVVVIRERDRVVYEPGYRLPRDREYVIIRDYDRYGLRRPPSGYDYYLVDDRVMRVSRDTLQIAAVIGLASALLN